MTEPPLSLREFFDILNAERKKSPTVVSDEVAAAQSWHARRSWRDAIIAERGRLYEASRQLVAGELVKISPSRTEPLEHYVTRRDEREHELEEARLAWWRVVEEDWPIPPTELQRIIRQIRWYWWVMIVVSLLIFWFFKR